LVAAMALDRDVQSVGGAAGQPAQVALRGADQRQHLVGQLQQLEAGGGETHRLGFAHEHRHAKTVFQLPELVRQRRLRQVQELGGFRQAVRFAQGMEGAQVSQVDHGQKAGTQAAPSAARLQYCPLKYSKGCAAAALWRLNAFTSPITIR